MTATLGEDAQRIDGRDKVSGKPIYGADRILRKMVHAVPVAATVRKGRVTGIDKSDAQHAPAGSSSGSLRDHEGNGLSPVFDLCRHVRF